MAKLKKIIKENFSVVGGVVTTPAVNAGYGSLSQIVKEKYGEQTQKISSEQVSEALKNYNSLGKVLYQQKSLKETAKKLSNIAEMAATHTVQETEDWFDKVTVSRNMKELTNHSKQFSKIAQEASSVQQRLEALYEDMGNVLSRYYDLNEAHTYGHESDDIETPELETGKENPYQEPEDDRYLEVKDDEITEEDTRYAKFFKGALKKFGVSSPAELGDKKKDFFNYVDKNYSAENETD